MPVALDLHTLDTAFPTVVRYIGLLLAVALVVAAILGDGGPSLASGGVLALGMILYKTVYQAASKEVDEDDHQK